MFSALTFRSSIIENAFLLRKEYANFIEIQCEFEKLLNY